MVWNRATRGSRFALIAAGLAGSLLCGSVLAGCGASSTGGGSSAKQFTYWSMWQENEPQATVLKSAMASFTKDTGIKVSVQWQGRSVLQKVIPALRGGNVPDLVDQGNHDVNAAMVVNGQSADLSAVYDAKVPGESATVAGSGIGKYRSMVTGSDGKPFMVPYEVISIGMFYNGAALPSVAKSPPTTWADFVQLLDRRKAAGRQPLAVDGSIGGYDAFWPTAAILADLGPGSLHKIAGDKSGAAWKDQSVLGPLNKIEHLAKGGYFLNGSFGSKFPAIQQKWAGGGSDFLLMGSWAPSETGKSAAAGMRYNSFEFPGFKAKSMAQAQVIGFAVPKRAQHSQAAQQFIEYMMKTENLAKVAEVAKNLVPRADVKPPPELADMAATLAAAKTLVPPEDNVDADYGTYSAEVYEALANDLLSGKINVRQFVDQISAKQANYWQTHG